AFTAGRAAGVDEVGGDGHAGGAEDDAVGLGSGAAGDAVAFDAAARRGVAAHAGRGGRKAAPRSFDGEVAQHLTLTAAGAVHAVGRALRSLFAANDED